MNSPGSNFIEPCKQNCIFSLSSWTDAESSGKTLPSLTLINIGHLIHRIMSAGRQYLW